VVRDCRAGRSLGSPGQQTDPAGPSFSDLNQTYPRRFSQRHLQRRGRGDLGLPSGRKCQQP
jgi:hypothetical protein